MRLMKVQLLALTVLCSKVIKSQDTDSTEGIKVANLTDRDEAIDYLASEIHEEGLQKALSDVLSENFQVDNDGKHDPQLITMDEPPKYKFDEVLELTPLPKNALLSSFQFFMKSNNFTVGKSDQSFDQFGHYTVFPKAIRPLMDNTNTRNLHLRFTKGVWDYEMWGQLPHNGLKSGGSGVELWAVIEAPNKDTAFNKWIKLANSLSGLFCASINFIDASSTTFPVSAFQPYDEDGIPLFDPSNRLYLLRAALANEPICTENLTPFLKLLPTKGKQGISTLLDGHKVFDSRWHSLSIDITTQCEDNGVCHYNMEEFIETVVNIPNTISRLEKPIPKPVDGSELRCDKTKYYDSWTCFPLPESTNVKYELSNIFGYYIMGGSSLSETSSKICVRVPDSWKVLIKVDNSYFSTGNNCFDVRGERWHDVYIETKDSSQVEPIKDSPVYVTRSLTVYGQDKGGLRTVFRNPASSPVKLLYFESLPWYMRLYLSTLEIESDSGLTIKDVIKSTYYLPASDRERPSHLEYEMTIPPNTTFSLTYQFDKSLLQYSEYPPDANHGFEIESAVVTVLSPIKYEFRTATLLLTLATPDFSMPYNVIILTSTVMGLVFGTLFNMLVKKIITVQEADEIIARNGPRANLRKLKQKLLNFRKSNTHKVN
ncbi:HEL085Cp [Eremothecium sinecaudum]|uniref:HEL085Cp n=1 Tax=Eremothecium sinecaudum TaxID=45286 RepID=A0A120K2D4_9SACH|nr:HEL085Cp [Eremothecium sinecaudum]AMD21195.1 HEL085Cp [Eremothecium sinecaudum]